MPSTERRQKGKVQFNADTSALSGLLLAASSPDPGSVWEVWTEEGTCNVKRYRFIGQRQATAFFEQKWVSRILCDPQGKEVASSAGKNRWALYTVRRRQRLAAAPAVAISELLESMGGTPASTHQWGTIRAMRALGAFTACEMLDEDNHCLVLETVAAKLDPDNVRQSNFPSNGLSNLLKHSIVGKGVLEPVLSNLQGIVVDRLINAIVGAFRSEVPSSCGLRSDEMGRGSSLEHPEYSNTIISAKTLSELMTAAETILTQECPKALQHLTLPETGRMIFVGDTHGQLQDVLWLFFKYGQPSRENVYFFNGDFVDRGGFGVEVMILLMALKVHDPKCLYMNRGNHEDESMTSYYGFLAELSLKFGTFGEGLHEQFMNFFQCLPICTVVRGVNETADRSAAVLHGGVPTLFRRYEAATLEQIANIDHRRPVPVMRRTCQEDEIFFCSLWSDPRDPVGIEIEEEDMWWPEGPSKRRGGGRGLAFGPAASADFLKRNEVDVILRSHEVPAQLRGFQAHHDGKVCTLFSASNYCGDGMNNGAVVLWDASSFPELRTGSGPGKAATLSEHWALGFSEIYDLMKTHETATQEVRTFVAGQEELKSRTSKAEFFVSSPELIEMKILNYLKEMVVRRKAELWQAFVDINTTGDYWVTHAEWCEVCASVMGNQFIWNELRKSLVGPKERNEAGDKIQYAKFLSRYTLTFCSKHGMPVGWQQKVLVSIFSRFLQQDLSLQTAIAEFDPDGDGFVSPDNLRAALLKVGAAITESQAGALLRTLTSIANDDQKVAVSDFLSLFSTEFAGHRRWAVEDEDLNWVPPCLEWIGNEVRRNSGHDSLIDVFREADVSGDGYLGREELKALLAKVLNSTALESEIEQCTSPPSTGVGSTGVGSLGLDDGPSSTMFFTTREKFTNVAEDEDALLAALPLRLDQVVRYLVAPDSAHVSLLAFMSAFAPRCAQEMRLDLLEHICVTIHQHKPVLRMALRCLDTENSGMVSKEDMEFALGKLNCALFTEEQGTPLTNEQISELVSCLEDGDGINIQAFLNSFEFVDTMELKKKPVLMKLTSVSFKHHKCEDEDEEEEEEEQEETANAPSQ
mmetsp:Transcript_45637/g.121056  ORF Transcript_45637/g.121056 Transcript_45637/m.121056 type:complete len:1089 (-) Transcript_45637:120-3386(-)